MGCNVSREQAGQIAKMYLEKNQAKFTLDKVHRLSEMKHWRVPPVDLKSPLNWKRVWIAFLINPWRQGRMIESATIMVISQVDGELVYWGSANDEG